MSLCDTELTHSQPALNLISHQFAVCVETAELTMSFEGDYGHPQQQEY